MFCYLIQIYIFDQGDYQEKCDKFEKGLGVVLRNAWQHVEALQTTDLPALINHIGDVLEAALEYPDFMERCCKEGDIQQRQEVMVFYYLNGLLRHLDDIHEDR